MGGEVQAQRDPHARVHAGGDLGGPVVGAREPLRLAGREGFAAGVGRGGGAGQGVGDRVQEGPHQGFRFGQADRSPAGQGDGVSLVREGRGDGPQVGDVVRVQGTRAPGVEAVGGEPRQQAAAGDEAQRVQRGGAPAHGGGMGSGVAPRPGEHGQGFADGEDQGGDGAPADARAVRPYDRQFRVLARGRSRAGRRRSVGVLPGRGPSTSSPAGRGSPRGSQNATRPSRGSGAGRKTAASRTEGGWSAGGRVRSRGRGSAADAEGAHAEGAPAEGTRAVTASAVSRIRPVTSRPSVESVVLDSTGGV